MTVVSKLSLRNFHLCRTFCSWKIGITFSTMCYPEYQTACNPKLKLHFQKINSNSASYKDKLKTNRCVCASVERTAFLPRKAIFPHWPLRNLSLQNPATFFQLTIKKAFFHLDTLPKCESNETWQTCSK